MTTLFSVKEYNKVKRLQIELVDKGGSRVSIFDWFKRKNQEEVQKIEPVLSLVQTEKIKKGVDFTRPVTEEEKELVSLISGVIASEHYSGKHFRVQHIDGIDTEKEIVSAIVGAVAANDNPHSHFKITSIERIN